MAQAWGLDPPLDISTCVKTLFVAGYRKLSLGHPTYNAS